MSSRSRKRRRDVAERPEPSQPVGAIQEMEIDNHVQTASNQSTAKLPAAETSFALNSRSMSSRHRSRRCDGAEQAGLSQPVGPIQETEIDNHVQTVSNQSMGKQPAAEGTNVVECSLKPEKKLVWECKVCKDILVEAYATICGHVLCERCIKVSIKAYKKCPLCPRSLSMKNYMKIYLPKFEFIEVPLLSSQAF